MSEKGVEFKGGSRHNRNRHNRRNRQSRLSILHLAGHAKGGSRTAKTVMKAIPLKLTPPFSGILSERGREEGVGTEFVINCCMTLYDAL